jgi:hypothetical protein
VGVGWSRLLDARIKKVNIGMIINNYIYMYSSVSRNECMSEYIIWRKKDLGVHVATIPARACSGKRCGKCEGKAREGEDMTEKGSRAGAEAHVAFYF